MAKTASSLLSFSALKISANFGTKPYFLPLVVFPLLMTVVKSAFASAHFAWYTYTLPNKAPAAHLFARPASEWVSGRLSYACLKSASILSQIAGVFATFSIPWPYPTFSSTYGTEFHKRFNSK